MPLFYTILATNIFQHPQNSHTIQIEELIFPSFDSIKIICNNCKDLLATNIIIFYITESIFCQYFSDNTLRKKMDIFPNHRQPFICEPRQAGVTGIFDMSNKCIRNALLFLIFKLHFIFEILAKESDSSFVVTEFSIIILIKFCHRQICCFI